MKLKLLSTVMIFELMLAPVNAGDQPATNETLQRVRAQAANQMSELDVSDAMKSELVLKLIEDFPLIPTEASINGFPAPISEDESDPAILQAYYNEVETAYRGRSEQFYAEATKSYEQAQQVRREIKREAFRTEDRTLDGGRRMTSDRDYLSASVKTPQKTRKLFGSEQQREWISFYQNQYHDKKVQAELYKVKGAFYEAMASALNTDNG